MQPRLLKFSDVEYVEAEFEGKNRSGYVPFGDRVLVLPDVASDRVGSIQITQQKQEQQTMSTVTGVIVAIGEGAFEWNSDKSTKAIGRKPVVGDRIFMERFAGQPLHGLDGNLYRVMDDRCIGAIKAEQEKA